MSKSKGVRGGIIGIIIGAIVGVLFAPKSGKETRDDIKEGTQAAMTQTEKQLKGLYKDLQDNTAAAKKSATTKTLKAKKEMDDLLKSSQPLQKQIKELISNIREGLDVDERDIEKLVEKAEKITQKIKKRT